jgi:hypothetical protein
MAMLRVQCAGCGKTVRGGADWSGRSGHCPKCGAVIIFPDLRSEFDRAEVAARASGQTLRSKISEALEFPNLGKLKFVVVVAATGVSLWAWCYLIVVLAYGRLAYNMAGLRVQHLSRRGVLLNNGEELNYFWHAIFMLGFLGLWYLLVEGADALVGRVRQKLLAWSLIVLAGVVAWSSLLYIDRFEARELRITFHRWPIRSFLSGLLAVAAVAALTYWRTRRSREDRLRRAES